MGKEIHLKNRPSGYADIEDFEIVEVEIPEVKKEGEFLVRNIWMSVDPFLRIYMVKGKSKTLSPFELDKVIDGGVYRTNNRIQKFKFQSWRSCEGKLWMERILAIQRYQ